MRVSTNMMYRLGSNELPDMQAKMLKLNQQVTLNQKVLLPSDDPLASSRALDLSQSSELNSQFKKTRDNAVSALAHVESKVSAVTGLLSEIRAKVIAAANGSYSNKERANMAEELKGNLEEFLGYANETDGLGNFLFSGFKYKTEPFVSDQHGNIVYQGDQGIRTLQVDSGREMGIGLPGSDIFQGNGEDLFKMMKELIVALETPATEAANKADAQNAEALPQFVTYKAAKDLLDAADPFDANYSTLRIDAAQKEEAWKIAEAKRTPVTGSLKDMTNKLGVAGTRIDKLIDNTGKVTADIGSRLKEIDNLNNVGELRDINYTAEGNRLLGRTPEDMADSISRLSLQQTYLAAAQKVFISTTGMSLLNYM